MSRLAGHTEALRARGRKALVAFLTAGYPTRGAFPELVRAAADAGADVIEIGVPFSDPIADGPVIQHASVVALSNGTTLQSALDDAARLSREVDSPLVVMSYINPILRRGVETFARDAERAGIAGVVLPDVSFEESGAFRAPVHDAGLAYIDLVAPTSDDARLRTIAPGSDGFVYVVSLTGVTGTREAVAADLPALLARVRAHAQVPVYVGFGVSNAAQAAQVAALADGVIIGSRLVRLAGDGAAEGAAARVGGFLAGVRRELDRA
jgi:tryptophan synthase alpha chain